MNGFINDIAEIDKFFFSEFLQYTVVKDKLSREMPFIEFTDFDVLVRYGNRSNKLAEQEVEKYFPAISIINLFYKIDTANLLSDDELVGNFRTLLNGDRVGDILTLPIPVKVSYQVSFASYSKKQYDEIRQWFFNTFTIQDYRAFFIFDKRQTDLGIIGIPVNYFADIKDLSFLKNFEGNFEFLLKSFLYLQKNITVDTLEQIELMLNGDENVLIY